MRTKVCYSPGGAAVFAASGAYGMRGGSEKRPVATGQEPGMLNIPTVPNKPPIFVEP